MGNVWMNGLDIYRMTTKFSLQICRNLANEFYPELWNLRFALFLRSLPQIQSLSERGYNLKLLTSSILVTKYQATSKKSAESGAHIGASIIRSPITLSSPKGDF
jgi:hypothetical protein